MSEKLGEMPQLSPERTATLEAIEKLHEMIAIVENALTAGGREAAKPLLGAVYIELGLLKGATPEETETLVRRVELLSSAIGILTVSDVRNDVGPLERKGQPQETPGAPENTTEHIPSLEEVLSIIKKLTEKEPTETRRREDKDGIYLLELTVTGAKAGETTEYSYKRKGTFPEGSSKTTGIAADYYEDGIPVGGNTVADCIDGIWKML